MHAGGFFSDLAMALDCVKHEIFVRYTTFPLHSRIKWKVNADRFRPFLTKNKHKGEIKSPNETQNYFFDWGIL